MKTPRTSSLVPGTLLVALVAAVGICILLIGAPAAAAPAPVPVAAPAAQPAGAGMGITSLPPSTCTLVTSTRTCELWAMTGTITTSTGITLPIWGFADSPAGPAQLPGPALIANKGETLKVVLHNQLPGENLALTFPGQLNQIPDLDGAATGATVTYTLPMSNPGTFLYEAGMTPNGGRQVAMGLYGGLVVRPVTPTQAYDDPATAYDDEALLVLSEIDPLFNLDPYGFVMTEYAPRYWLINGKSYPETAEILTIQGNKVLLRYVNAGLESHWMGLLELQQQVVASDGRPVPLPRQVVAQTIASGQTIDALVQVPASVMTDTRYALYDTNLLLHNANDRATANGPLAFGGMMTFLRTVTGTALFAAGPVSTVGVDPSPTTGDGGVTLTIHIDDSTTGGLNVVAAEYFVDTLGPVGSGTSLAVGAPAPVVDLSEFIPASTLAGWPSGYPTFYVRGQDAGGNWGFVGSAVLNLDKLGPTSTSMSLWPEPTNGNYSVVLRATGDDHSSGHNPVVAATYSIDGGPAAPLSLRRTDSPITAMTATLVSSPTLLNLAEGLHPIAISAQDSLGNWGAPAVITLTLDKTGPEAPLVTLAPNVLDLSGAPAVTSVKLTVLVTDALSAGVQTSVANAEAFIDVAGPDGTGFALFPADGLFDEASEAAYFDIPIANFINLAQGDHPVFVHGLDAAGNWGPLGAATITIDRGVADTEGPAITSIDVAPNPTNGAASVTLTAGAADAGLLSDIAAGEWFVGADPGPGLGLPMQAADGAFDSPSELLRAVIDVSGWANGGYRLSVRAQDALGNWGGLASVRLRVLGNNAVLILTDGFEAGGLDAWNAAVGPVRTAPEAVLAPDGGTMGLLAPLDGGVPAYLSHLMPAGEVGYRATFYFDPNGADVGTDEHDILVGLNSGTPILGIQVEASGSGSGYEIRGWAMAAGATVFTNWYDLGDAAHKLGLEWKANAAGSFSLAIDDVVVEELAGLNTAAYALHEIRLGPSANLDAAMAGAEYFDAFEARRLALIYMPVLHQGH